MKKAYIFRHKNTSNLAIVLANSEGEARVKLGDRFAIPREFELYNSVNGDNDLCVVTLKELNNTRDEAIKAQIGNIIDKM